MDPIHYSHTPWDSRKISNRSTPLAPLLSCWRVSNGIFDPEVLKSGFGVIFLIWSGEFWEIAKFHSEFLQRFFSENFSVLFLQGFRPPPKNQAQNSHPKSSAFLSNIKFLNPSFFHTDVLLTGETNSLCEQGKTEVRHFFLKHLKNEIHA